jgi:hypothetical protein
MATPKNGTAKAGFTVELTMTKETKGTFVYTSDAADTPIPSVYIRKTGFPNGAPKMLTLVATEK